MGIEKMRIFKIIGMRMGKVSNFGILRGVEK
jgi:hypothetical protein